jgi:hypothetical protein
MPRRDLIPKRMRVCDAVSERMLGGLVSQLGGQHRRMGKDDVFATWYREGGSSSEGSGWDRPRWRV